MTELPQTISRMFGCSKFRERPHSLLIPSAAQVARNGQPEILIRIEVT
jgi:hypothetical protein